jgi:hypothetical protein
MRIGPPVQPVFTLLPGLSRITHLNLGSHNLTFVTRIGMDSVRIQTLHIRTIVPLAAVLFGGAATTLAQSSDHITTPGIRVAIGLYDARRENPQRSRQIEMTLGDESSTIRPIGGVIVTTSNDSYTYIGATARYVFLEHLFVGLSFAAGLYSHGRGTNLMHPLEFLERLEVAWQWGDGYRVGVAISHLSNAGLGPPNPGLEVVSIAYAFPLPR